MERIFVVRKQEVTYNYDQAYHDSLLFSDIKDEYTIFA